MGPNSDFLNAADCPMFTKGECHLQSQNDAKDAKIKGLEARITELKDECSDLRSIAEKEPDWETVDVGLDKIYYKLHSGNLKIQLQLEGFINQLKQQNNASIKDTLYV